MKAVNKTIAVFAAQACAISALYAGTTLYKSVDDRGRVTYSDTPLAGDQVEKVAIPDGTANVLSSESAQRLIKEQEASDRQSAASQKAAEQDWSERYRQAERSVEQAERDLENAKTVQEGDLVGNALAGARPNAAWIERLEQAEATLQARRGELDQLRQQR